MTDVPIHELKQLCRRFRQTSDDKRNESYEAADPKHKAALRGQADAWMVAANKLNTKIEAHEDE